MVVGYHHFRKHLHVLGYEPSISSIVTVAGWGVDQKDVTMVHNHTVFHVSCFENIGLTPQISTSHYMAILIHDLLRTIFGPGVFKLMVFSDTFCFAFGEKQGVLCTHRMTPSI